MLPVPYKFRWKLLIYKSDFHHSPLLQLPVLLHRLEQSLDKNITCQDGEHETYVSCFFCVVNPEESDMLIYIRSVRLATLISPDHHWPKHWQVVSP